MFYNRRQQLRTRCRHLANSTKHYSLIGYSVLLIRSPLTVPSRLLSSISANLLTVHRMKLAFTLMLSMSLYQLSGIPLAMPLVTHNPFWHLNGILKRISSIGCFNTNPSPSESLNASWFFFDVSALCTYFTYCRQRTGTCSIYRKFGKMWTCSFFRYASIQTYKQTNRHTNRQQTYRRADRDTSPVYRVRSDNNKKLSYSRGNARRTMSIEKKLAVGEWSWRSFKVNGVAAIQYTIYHFLLVVCSNNNSILHRDRDITTFTEYATTCDLAKSFIFDKTVEITSHVRFPVYV